MLGLALLPKPKFKRFEGIVNALLLHPHIIIDQFAIQQAANLGINLYERQQKLIKARKDALVESVKQYGEPSLEIGELISEKLWKNQ